MTSAIKRRLDQLEVKSGHKPIKWSADMEAVFSEWYSALRSSRRTNQPKYEKRRPLAYAVASV